MVKDLETPLEFKEVHGNDERSYSVYDAVGRTVMDDELYYNEAPLKHQAQAMVHAVNCYDDLLEALELFTVNSKDMTFNERVEYAEQVIAKAKGE